ncbi:glycoside hydrolase family 52 protein [Dactylosporangium siamense]|uniref:glycoside hydrolase family 52 protein n=1 Tax=Dactylosporangium siamense TaxID=685454 RepID=UPI001942E89F|nr:glycoside hydrolase family 52 protein [Dactylosporangium siamense]
MPRGSDDVVELTGAEALFNAHHAPVGAFASVTLGASGAAGGLGIGLEGPAGADVFVGVESADGRCFELLPFFDPEVDDRARYDAQLVGAGGDGPPLHPVAAEAMTREFGLSRDTWAHGDLRFSLYSPVGVVPDPDTHTTREVADAILPSVLAELTLDNSAGARPRRVFLGYTGADLDAAMWRVDGWGDLAGVAQGRTTALVSDCADVRSGVGFSVGGILADAEGGAGLGRVGLLWAVVPAGAVRTLRFAFCFHRSGLVTTGIEASYAYTRHYPTLRDVATRALGGFDAHRGRWAAEAAALTAPGLPAQRRFQLAHAVRSYVGCTQLLDDGAPRWVVNEGEYRMINTLDLTVDQVFFELRHSPWLVRNVLDAFADRYRYDDDIHAPDGRLAPGGVAFTHDMGVGNAFAPPGRSAYERPGLRGCFSHMAHEELLNWSLCAALYVARTGDHAWRDRHAGLLGAVVESLARRDDPDPRSRTGVMGWDSARTGDGWEITTYDSLDPSLGRARGSVYLAVKSWAAYVCLAPILAAAGDDARAALAAAQARRCARTLLAAVGPDGALPAVLDDPAVHGRVVPAVEGLVYPWFAGIHDALDPAGEYGELIVALRRHLDAVLVAGVCLFDDGGWRLSSSSGNSWLSKIYLAQFVAERILGRDPGEAGRVADEAHARWLRDPRNARWAWSDQMQDGLAVGSRYYPRGVTAVLWLEPPG